MYIGTLWIMYRATAWTKTCESRLDGTDATYSVPKSEGW